MIPTYRWFRGGSVLTGQASDTLPFSPLRETDSGVYTCEGTRSSIAVTSESMTITVMGKCMHESGLVRLCIDGAIHTESISHTDSALSAVITASGQSIEGQTYSVTCEVVGDESLAVSSRTLRWDKDGVETSRNPTLTFNPLSPSDAAEYRCTSNFFSPYLTGSRTVTATVTVTVHGNLQAIVCVWRVGVAIYVLFLSL